MMRHGATGWATTAAGMYLHPKRSSSTSLGRGTQNPKVKVTVQKGQEMHKQMDYA